MQCDEDNQERQHSELCWCRLIVVPAWIAAHGTAGRGQVKCSGRSHSPEEREIDFPGKKS